MQKVTTQKNKNGLTVLLTQFSRAVSSVKIYNSVSPLVLMGIVKPTGETTIGHCFVQLHLISGGPASWAVRERVYMS